VPNHREPSTESAQWYAIACAAVLAFAAVLRFRGLDASLFEDEVWVADLVRNGGWHPHSYSVPPLFYAIERAWAAIRGAGPSSLREPPAFFGILLATIPLLANRDRVTRLLWSVLLGFSSPLVFYSSRIKQYTLEACVVAVLIVILLRALESDSRMAWLAFFAVAIAGVTTLYSPIFFVGAAALVVVPRAPRLTLGFALVFAAFAAAYFGYLAPGPESIRLHGDMQAFFTQNGRWVTSPSSLFHNTLHFTGEMMNLVRGWWIVVAAAGAFCLTRREDLPLVVVAIAPVAAVAAASVWHFYPYGEVRLMIFAFPAIFLVIASGLAAIAARVTVPGSVAVGLFLFAFAWNAVVRDTYNATYMHVHDLRPLYDFVAANRRRGDAVLAVDSLEAPLRYHHPEVNPGRWQGEQVTITGWYLGVARVPSADVALNIDGAWASRVSVPSAAGSAPPPGSP